MGAGRADRSFPKAYRLASSEDFRRVYRSRTRGRVGSFTWHARNNVCHHPRLGLAVPKRVVKRATDRSRVKRLIRESFRHHRGELPLVDIVISVKTLPDNLHDPALGRILDGIWSGIASSMSAGNQQRSSE